MGNKFFAILEDFSCIQNFYGKAKSESPLKYKSASYFSIANYAINLDSCGDIHCTLGLPLAIENRRN
jgi:hypothetical protein